MNIILEGPDATGKTTLAQKLRDKYGMSILHSTSKTRNDLYYHIDLLDYRDNTVFDRFHLGEMIYPVIYGRDGKLSEDDFNTINTRIIDNNDIVVVFCTSDMNIINQRLIDRGEEEYLKEMQQQNELFIERAKSLKGYKNFYLIDIAEDDAYDRLDTWLEERIPSTISVNRAYKKLCNDLLDNGHVMGTRNLRGSTVELCNYMMTITDLDEEYISLLSGGSNLAYLAAELLWYWSARNDVEFIGKFAKMWSKISDDGKTANSAYGYILQKKHGFNQIEKIIELLKVDPMSRRAVLNINVPNENVIDTKDEMCTVCMDYQIRDGKLHCTTVMRSNDMHFGAANDLPFFISLQKYIANKVGVPVGTYNHFAASIHFYDRDFKYVKDIAYGTMEKSKWRLDIEKLLDNREELVDWVDNKFTSREGFKDLLISKGIIYDTIS